MVKYYPPELNKSEFNCPYCGVYSHQSWYPAIIYGERSDDIYYYLADMVRTHYKSAGTLSDFSVSECSHCHQLAIWLNDKMLVPRTISVPPPSELLPEKIKELYNEAGTILNDSPRAAGALIRLALELLLKQVNNNDQKLYDNIDVLIKKGVPEEIIKAMTLLRHSGNEMLHAGEISIIESRDQVLFLFELFNMIAEDLIERPKRLNEAYNRIPESIRKDVERKKDQ